ncbi:MAG TPA: YoaK family protein [Chitinophagales bacterium]|jgi:uncharacterized membrane protein YoaK (UPF0700 family)|nr:DUF1275 domain-containing protein [Chitinophagales bacterium]MBP6154514.1 DUF1275 domain-containing protein [Chitinophagales bacterium]HQV78705.1 YoaK family protein [Chitinophagales bacterium]HQW79071.1 YoaK family protein [Chitinophagales bacterium]
MFKHKGKTRTYSHNLQIASLLSFVAGLVNVAGFFSVQHLTTNVTGHFAFLMDEIIKSNYITSIVFFLFILFFFLGSFFSNFLIEIIGKRSERFVYIVPVSIEIIVLILIGVFGNYLIDFNPNLIAFGLLFSMGLQNSLVTTISNSVVRTTHLTGLFTDLGIELSQLFFYTELQQKTRLKYSIRLRLIIIFSFFLGGILGGYFYKYYGLYVLFFAALSLLIGLIYDSIKFRIILLHRKIRNL